MMRDSEKYERAGAGGQGGGDGGGAANGDVKRRRRHSDSEWADLHVRGVKNIDLHTDIWFFDEKKD